MNFYITHISTACVLLEIGGVRILTDPVLDGGVKRYSFGLGINATRAVGPWLPSGGLPRIHATLLSHASHKDNLDDSGLAAALQGDRIIGGLDAVETLTKLGHGDRVSLVKVGEGSVIVKGDDGDEVEVLAVKARHGHWVISFLPEVSHVVGFIIRHKASSLTIYVSGDTVLIPEIQEALMQHRVQVALLHLGAVTFWPPLPPFIRFTLNAKEAAEIGTHATLQKVVPIHFETSVWSHFRQEFSDYVSAFDARQVQDKLQWLTKGVRTRVDVEATVEGEAGTVTSAGV